MPLISSPAKRPGLTAPLPNTQTHISFHPSARPRRAYNVLSIATAGKALLACGASLSGGRGWGELGGGFFFLEGRGA